MNAVVVYGATGHTGRFVVEELLRRGLPTVIAGRDATTLETLASKWGDVDVRPAAVDDPHALDQALAKAAAVINCAGPFAATATPVIEAAGRARIPYVDVAAEIEANLSTIDRHADTPVVPAMAFYSGLGDLLTTAVLGERTTADEVHVAYGLSSWHPTPGTRAAGQVSHDRRAGRRLRFTGGELQYHDDKPVQQDWIFPEPLGLRRVIPEFTMADGAHLYDRRGGGRPVQRGYPRAGSRRRTGPLRPVLRRRRAGPHRWGRAAGDGTWPGHLRDHGSARGGGRTTDPRRRDADDRCGDGRGDVRRDRLPEEPAAGGRLTVGRCRTGLALLNRCQPTPEVDGQQAIGFGWLLTNVAYLNWGARR